MISIDTEYSMLKQEILQLTSACDNLVIAMYTVTIAILAVAFETNNYNLFLLPFVVLFSFQGILNRKRAGIVRIVAYIVVYLEEEKGWESKGVCKQKIGDKRIKMNKMISFLFGRSSSAQLGLICCMFFGYFYIEERMFILNRKDIVLLSIVFLLWLGLLWMNRTVLFNVGNRNAYIKAFRKQKKEKN